MFEGRSRSLTTSVGIRANVLSTTGNLFFFGREEFFLVIDRVSSAPIHPSEQEIKNKGSPPPELFISGAGTAKPGRDGHEEQSRPSGRVLKRTGSARKTVPL